MSSLPLSHATYGFRFLDTLDQPFCQLFSVGYDLISSHSYRWEGLRRTDGPLFLFQYTLSGKGSLVMDDHDIEVHAGQAFLVDIPSDHVYFLPESSVEWEFLFILIRPDQISNHWAELIKKYGRIWNMSIDSPPILLLSQIIHDASRERIQDGYRASELVYRFIMELFRLQNTPLQNKEAWPIQIQNAIQYVEQHYARIETLDQIAHHVGLSKYHFNRLFSRTTGMTPISYVAKTRMKQAILLLRNSRLTMDEIAKDIGYTNGNYFSKVFRQWVGFSPGEFRDGVDIAAYDQIMFD
ncbi:Arabinose operon regulatory protein [compost metagenome]